MSSWIDHVIVIYCSPHSGVLWHLLLCREHSHPAPLWSLWCVTYPPSLYCLPLLCLKWVLCRQHIVRGCVWFLYICIFYSFVFWDGVFLYSLAGPGVHYVVQTGLKFSIFLFCLLNTRDYGRMVFVCLFVFRQSLLDSLGWFPIHHCLPSCLSLLTTRIIDTTTHLAWWDGAVLICLPNDPFI